MPNMDKCPYCSKQIMKGAMRCPGCGKILKTAEEQQRSIEQHKESVNESNFLGKLKTIAVLIVIALIAYAFREQIQTIIRDIIGK